jgi:hypothetical protein
MKVIYPGPAVVGTARLEPTLHPRMGRLELGENEQPDDAETAAALAAGLLETPEDAKKRLAKEADEKQAAAMKVRQDREEAKELKAEESRPHRRGAKE